MFSQYSPFKALCRPSGGWPSRPDRTREQCPWNPTPKIKLHPDQLRPSYIQSLDSKQILHNFWIWNKWNWLKCALPIILSQPQSWWKALLGFISPFTSIYQHIKTEIYQCLDEINDDYEEQSILVLMIIVIMKMFFINAGDVDENITKSNIYI